MKKKFDPFPPPSKKKLAEQQAQLKEAFELGKQKAASGKLFNPEDRLLQGLYLRKNQDASKLLVEYLKGYHSLDK